jgi:polar amino acid transport system substrate-binding protein
MLPTVNPGALVVQSAYPDPPFELMREGETTGSDIELMRAVCSRLELELKTVAFEGDDFNDIFSGLLQGTCDAVISGTTITPERSAKVRFSKPYLTFNQGIAVNRRVTPNVVSFADLRGLTAGIQFGNTSDLVARRLLAQGDIAR